jgi:c-di-GMP-binding flagellar brake protein YcgR
MAEQSNANLQAALAEQLHQLTGELQATRDLRQHPRLQKDGQIRLHVSYQRQPLAAQLRDVSAGGIGFVHREAMEQGMTFTIQFTTDGGARSIKYKVVRCRRLERGRYEVGAEIIHVSRETKEK